MKLKVLKFTIIPLSIIIFTLNLFPLKNAKDIVKKIDEMYRSKTSYGKVEMIIETPHWKRTILMEMWTEGMEKTLIRILSPKKDKNISTLKIGNKIYNYLPKVNKIIKIPPSMMMSSWMGSDFTNDDLVKEYTFIDDYKFSIIQYREADKKEDELYIQCIPKDGVAVVWGKIIIAVKKTNYLPLWEKFYDEKGNLIRILRFSEPKIIGKKLVPTKMEMIPLKKKGRRTIIRYIELKFNVKLDSSIFSLRKLRSFR